MSNIIWIKLFFLYFTFNRSTSSEVCAGLETEASRFFANCDVDPWGFLYGLPDIVGLTVTCDTRND